MSRKIVIPGVTFTGPALRDDPIINAGSLLLVDVNHPVAPWASIPAAGALIPNIARAQASTLIGSTADADVCPVITTGRTPPAITLTSKGSLRMASTGPVNGWHIKYPPAIIGYIKANPAHRLGLCLWCGLDGPSTAVVSGIWTYLTTDSRSTTDNTKSSYSRFSPTSSSMNSAGSSGTQSPSGNTTVSPREIVASSGTSDDNGATAVTAQKCSRIIGTGNVPASPTMAGIPNGAGASLVFHRFYLEDLTASGRTLAALTAADQALYQAAFAAGGRYSATEYTGV
ncbi:MAG: hypothetical protein L0K84_10355 [Acidipropionibacterium jensenii]|nr:hypothetical protein [Acidipropionibacterium jensenii]